jgi:RNA polymerase sigma-70 factor (ECF subfamily)
MDAELRTALTPLLPRLRRFAMTLAGSLPEADALVQAACERALRTSQAWLPGTRLDSWLYRIIHDIWIDRRVPPAPADAPVESGPTGERAGIGPTLDAVRRDLATMPEEQRTILLLVCADGFTYKETAEALGIPTASVIRHLAHARLALMGGVRLPDASDAQDP